MSSYKSDFLNVMEERGFIHQGSDLEGLDKKLASGPQGAYIGFDATASSFHVGNLVQIMMLYWFQQTGNKPYTLMGGGTTKVGDPSGKDEMRKMLTDEAIDENIENLKGIFGQFLTYGNGKTDAIMVNNDEWLKDIQYIPFLRDYGKHFSINRMLTFDSVKTRLEREQSLSFLEFNYMILQAYDFAELHKRHGLILQMGGSDQWGNIINGVELGRRSADAELYALTTPLITTASGAKMGKSADGAVWLAADKLSPYDYYQFWRNTDDADVVRFLKIFTTLPMDEIAKLAALEGKEINEAKKVLAFEATKLCHSEEAAIDAANTAQKVFEQGGTGDELPSITYDKSQLDEGVSFIDAVCEIGLTKSKGEARRIVQQGGAKVNDEPINDPQYVVTSAALNDDGQIKISTSKKKHALILAKSA